MRFSDQLRREKFAFVFSMRPAARSVGRRALGARHTVALGDLCQRLTTSAALDGPAPATRAESAYTFLVVADARRGLRLS